MFYIRRGVCKILFALLVAFGNLKAKAYFEPSDPVRIVSH